MQNHLQLHQFDHAERLKRAEDARRAAELTQTAPKRNPALMSLGTLLVEAGEHLQRSAAPLQHEHVR